MPKTFITNLDKLEKEIHTLFELEDHISGGKTVKAVNIITTNYIPNCSTNKPIVQQPKPKRTKTKLPKMKSKLRNKPEEKWSTTFRSQSISPNVSTQDDVCSNYATLVRSNVTSKINSCPGSTCNCSQLETLSNSPMKSRSSLNISGGMVNDCEQVALELNKEIEKAKYNLYHISQYKMEALNMTKALKSSYIDLMENKDTLFHRIQSLQVENQTLKKKLDEKNSTEFRLPQVTVKKSALKKSGNQIDKENRKCFVKSCEKLKMRKCLREKEECIKNLQKMVKHFEHMLQEKVQSQNQLKNRCDQLQVKLNESIKNNSQLTSNNHNLVQFVKNWESQLKKAIEESERCRTYIHQLEEEICRLRKVVDSRISESQLLGAEEKLKDMLEREVTLNTKIQDLKSQISEMQNNDTNCKCIIDELHKENEELKEKYNEVHNKLHEYENCASRCKELEVECKNKCEALIKNEQFFQIERNEMRKLVDELTNVVKHNKCTLLEMSEINKYQERIIKSQSAELLSQEEKIRLATSEYEMMRKRSIELEEHISNILKDNEVEGSCKQRKCAQLNEEVKQLKSALSIGQDNELLKEKIIEDQSKTIFCLQTQMKDQSSKLTEAQRDVENVQNEITHINNQLYLKQQELEKEKIVQENMLHKLKKLEKQKSELSIELVSLKDILGTYKKSTQLNDNQQEKLAELRNQLESQKREFALQKNMMDAEKEKAVHAAEFATQKLMETVNDFQKQVDAQKKVQKLLTSMLHDKDSQLKIVKSKITSITAITHAAQEDLREEPTRELFRSGDFEGSPHQCASTQIASSNSSKKVIQNSSNDDLEEILKLLGEV